MFVVFRTNALEALDQYEGVDGGYYEKKILKVEKASGNEEIDAWVYLSNDYDYGIPSSEYQAIVIRGAKDEPVKFLHPYS